MTTSSNSLTRRRISVRQIIVLTAVILAAAVTAGGVSTAQAANPQSRRTEPFMAGTALRSATDNTCTAGLVLKDNSFLGDLTEYRRSVRFILTAGRCGSIGTRFTTPDGNAVGNAVWKSATHDFLLIRVEPRLDYGVAPGCAPGSQGLPCVAISSHYYPKAVGNVFIDGAPLSHNLPVRATRMSGQIHCISGGYNGTMCRHTAIDRPQSSNADPAYAKDLSFTRGPMTIIGPGSSGAPLFSSTNANVFGILHDGWSGTSGTSGMSGARYTAVSLFFIEQSSYALAPPE